MQSSGHLRSDDLDTSGTHLPWWWGPGRLGNDDFAIVLADPDDVHRGVM